MNVGLHRAGLLPIALLVAAAVPYFVDLGGSSIWDANEAFYAQTPREMIARGDYVSPTFNWEPRFNKPVLSYWVVAVFYRAFGEAVAVERLPIALGGLAIILTAFFLGRAATADVARGPDAHHGARGAGGTATSAGIWAALGLALSPRLLMFSRRIVIDIYISMFMALTLLFFALAERHPEHRRRYLALMYVAIGLGVLTKGPIAVVIPCIVFGLYLLVHREPGRVRQMMIPAGAVLLAAIVLPWYALILQRHGWTHITAFIYGENIARYASGFGVEQSRGILFYLPVVLGDAFPVSVFLLGAARLWLGHARKPVADPATRIQTLLWLWILTIVGFFSLSAAKQDLYVFPIVPAVAALAGVFIATGGAAGMRRILTASVAAVALFLVVGGGSVLYALYASGRAYGLTGADTVGVVAVAGGLIALATTLIRTPIAGWCVAAATVVVLNWAFVLQVLPGFERYKPVPALTQAIAERLRPGDLVVHYNVALPSMVYYLNRHVDVLFRKDLLLERLRTPRTVYAVLNDIDYDALMQEAAVPICVIARAPTFSLKLGGFLARQPLPEMVVVTNRCQP